MALIGLGVSGGIGAYKAVELTRLLQKRGHDVQAIMTRAAARFVGPLTFEAITRRPVITSQWKPGANADIEHISVASDIVLLVVAPATANVIGKFAGGIADDFLSSLYLATAAPVLLAPAMNTNMLAHPAVQRNLAELAARGVKFVDPGEGYLACGWIGKGRLAEPEMIAAAVDRMLSTRQSLTGRHVIVTAGPTYEDLDPVRFVGNRSSGKMGYALAAELSARGASVTLITGPTSLAVPAVATLVRVRSAREMHLAVMDALPQAEVLVMAAAVANYTAEAVADQKIAHEGGPLTVTLVPTADILADAAAWRWRQGRSLPLLVGFAAETSNLLERARAKRVRKGIDVIVANDVAQPGAGFEVDTNQVTVIDDQGDETLPFGSKRDVASALADRLERWLRAMPASAGTPA
jgi:phosphopantothenoylcysteine decarboxylase / phosphopantothenate---cysteine ligase